MKRANLFVTLALAALSAAPVSAQILTNGSFELDPDLSGWGSWGGVGVATPATPFSNQDGARVADFPVPAPGFSVGLTQFFALTPNTDYTFSARVAGGTTGDDSVIRFLLADSAFTLALDQRQFVVATTGIGGAMAEISYTFNSGAVGAAGLQIDAYSAGSATPRAVFLDQVAVEPVAVAPEPGTLALGLVGLAGLARRRRR